MSVVMCRGRALRCIGAAASRLAGLALVAGLGALALAGCGHERREPVRAAPTAKSEPTPGVPWALTSDAFENDGEIPRKYTCEGEDVSPPLSWGEPPAGTVEMALICSDPDAPAGTWVHWVLYGIPPGMRLLPEGVPKSETVPELKGIRQGLNSSGQVGYMGPCPPVGPHHHYQFVLYALDVKLDLLGGAREPEVSRAMEGHVIGQAELVGLYAR